MACKSERWGPDVTDPLGQAVGFGPQCRSTRSPLACVLMAFAHGTVDGKFTAVHKV